MNDINGLRKAQEAIISIEIQYQFTV